MAEVWKVIPGFAGYEASSLGRIRSNRCGGIHGAALTRSRPKVMVGLVSHDGYRRVGVRDDTGKRRTIYVHQLVLFTFVGPRPEGQEASHVSGDQLDNRPENLRWETKPENNSRKKAHGTQPRKYGSANPASKLTDEQRAKIRSLYAAGGVSQRALADRFGVAQSSIGDVIRGDQAHG